MQVLTSSSHFAAVARTLRHASATFATAGKAVGQATGLQQELGPRSFLHDLVVLANTRAAGGIRMAAARRLARRHARPKMIFHRARWLQLEDAFRVWRGERGFWEGWQDLVAPYIYIAFKDIPRDIPLREVWPHLRRRLRRAIELDLLGYTLDGRLRFSAHEDEEPIVPEAVAEAAHLSLELAESLQILTPEEQAFLLEYRRAGSAGRKALAKRLGVRYDTLRQRASRLLRKLKRFHR